MKTKLIMLLVVSASLIAAGCNKAGNMEQPEQSGQQSANNIIIENYNFTPHTLRVEKGATLTWVNQDEAKHTVTGFNDKGPQSESLAQGQTHSHTFNKPGVYEYFC